MISRDRYQEIVTLCTELVTREGARPVLGADFADELADVQVYDTITFADDGDKVTINATRETARPPFEWLAEVSTWGQIAVHVLVYPDGRVVEAYGHQLFDVSDHNAESLLHFIRRLSS